jgi:hypothetical protein
MGEMSIPLREITLRTGGMSLPLREITLRTGEMSSGNCERPLQETLQNKNRSTIKKRLVNFISLFAVSSNRSGLLCVLNIEF